jgi:hypothetical protein
MFAAFCSHDAAGNCTMSNAARLVLVAGDVLTDHHLYDGVRRPAASPEANTRLEQALGGAGLIHALLSSLAEQDSYKSSAPSAPDRTAWRAELLNRPSTEQYSALRESFAIWRLQPRQAGEKNFVWRMSDPLGYGPPHSGPVLTRRSEYDGVMPAVLVLDDANQGFRLQSSQASWPAMVTAGDHGTQPWIVMKMSRPLAQGDLWRALRHQFGRRLIVVLSIDDIRREQVLVTKGISWERTALDLAFELRCNPAVKDLLDCEHLVISLGLEGALVVHRLAEGERQFRLIYDPQHLEGESGSGLAGTAVGFATCLTCAIAREFARAERNEASAVADVEDHLLAAIRAGLAGMRKLRELGHGPAEANPPAFPFAEVSERIRAYPLDRKPRFEAIDVPTPDAACQTSEQAWTIVTASQEHINVPRIPLYGLAARVARGGQEQFGGVPYVRYGKLFTVDRTEIESLQAIQRLVVDYLRSEREERPLSLAVFGPPGSGKSFGVKQLAKELYGREYRQDAPILEFNLSQFSGENELIGALHVVRDKVLAGPPPLVFWDEFDSGAFQWLQKLLAPMQDGKFNEGQIQHPLGKCIFVFAGGTSFDFQNFGLDPKTDCEYADFKLKKGPDFKSRLSGYLNVLGPNPRQMKRLSRGKQPAAVTMLVDRGEVAKEASPPDLRQEEWADDKQDICFPLRRALLIRTALGLGERDRLDIDSGILSALLEVKRYRHGARSLEKILLHMKAHRDGQAIRRSALPPRELVEMHADYDELRRIANRDMHFQALGQQMAPKIHADWRQRKRVKVGEDFPWNVAWEELPNWLQDENIAAAVRISRILAMVGLRVVPEEDPSPDETDLVNKILRLHLEFLAEEEHSGWKEHKERNNWRYGKPRSDEQRIHDNLVAYADLPDDIKQFDRNSILHFPATVAIAGFRIIRMGNGEWPY